MCLVEKDYKMLLFICEQKPFYGLAKRIHLVFSLPLRAVSIFTSPRLMLLDLYGGGGKGGRQWRFVWGIFGQKQTDTFS